MVMSRTTCSDPVEAPRSTVATLPSAVPVCDDAPMSTISQEEATWFGDVFGRITANVERAIVGRPHIVRLAVACMFSQGHLLLEDTSGTGKTTLARAIARCVYGPQSRIQFTPDLRPSDITGIVRFDERSERYRLYPGPIFNSLVVADEINRAAPRTQSALLEVMEEGLHSRALPGGTAGAHRGVPVSPRGAVSG